MDRQYCWNRALALDLLPRVSISITNTFRFFYISSSAKLLSLCCLNLCSTQTFISQEHFKQSKARTTLNHNLPQFFLMFMIRNYFSSCAFRVIFLIFISIIIPFVFDLLFITPKFKWDVASIVSAPYQNGKIFGHLFLYFIFQNTKRCLYIILEENFCWEIFFLLLWH